ncbi:hypothetical protein HY768_05195 [candidate division TA06 bacterium]|uniref:Uncharacterized protein n=1 Tax=candidate division TA06 bacterium TaxID=2250710 RepID=A0A933MKC8_UNCT6|nr:hypothetical protein [candidate division TA06 bacterium]
MDSIYIDGQMPSPERQKELLAKIADQIVKRKLTTPAILFFESVKPLSFVGSQALVFLQPIIQAFLNRREYDEIVLMMEERENVEKLLLEIESQEAVWQQREQAEKAEAKKVRSLEGKKPWFQRFKRSFNRFTVGV